MQKVKPLKKFGQNYLKDQNILNKIVDEISPQEEDNIVEIGPGLGALTEKLLERINTLTAIEIDTRVYETLLGKFPGLKLVQGDFLKFDLKKLFLRNNKLIRITGNIPYNLTSSIIFKIIENDDVIMDAILMVQHEVAQRMTAVRGTKDYGILSVLLGYFTETNICFKVSPNVFYPKPKIFSSVIHIYMKKKELNSEFKNYFIKIVKASFGYRRKTLKNSLSNSIFGDVNFSDSGIDLSQRAEQLEINDFIVLAKYVQNKSRNQNTN